MTTIRPHSWRAWLLATRPKTLSAALLSVLVAIVLAFTHSVWLNPHAPTLALLCGCFAAFMQIASNLINDYMDHRDGVDTTERLGPERACQQGWISPQSMRSAIVLCLLLALCCGGAMLLLLLLTSSLSPFQLLWRLIALGLACVWGAFAYSRWFSRWALGDILVLLFFGLVPTGGTYFVLTDTLPSPVLLLGLALGFAVDALLVVNNFRDRHTDLAVGKHTLVNLLPSEWIAWLIYPLVGVVAYGLLLLTDYSLHGHLGLLSALLLPYCCLHVWISIKMWRIRQGKALNAILGHTSLNLLLLLCLLCLALWGGTIE